MANPSGAKKVVVADVRSEFGSIQITEERLLRFAQLRPDKSLSTLLSDLIEFELLASKARQAGFETDEHVIKTRDQMIVRKYLESDFEPLWTADTIPRSYLESSYARNKNVFNHPELREASHIVITNGGKRPTEADVDKSSAALADKIYKDFLARPVLDMEAFLTRAKAYEKSGEELGVQVQGQRLRRFARKGRFAKDFTDRVFAHTEPKTIIPPFVTQFGYHVVWLDAAIPARTQTLNDVIDELRQKIVPEVRMLKMRSFIDELAKKYPPISNLPGLRRLANPQPLELLELSTAKPVD
ncbi:MAG: peptidylprolyl isomerase [Myxococcota bacterium]|nr:peptidylprolyl isomerase [Myxococcota bacterium]